MHDPPMYHNMHLGLVLNLALFTDTVYMQPDMPWYLKLFVIYDNTKISLYRRYIENIAPRMHGTYI